MLGLAIRIFGALRTDILALWRFLPFSVFYPLDNFRCFGSLRHHDGFGYFDNNCVHFWPFFYNFGALWHFQVFCRFDVFWNSWKRSFESFDIFGICQFCPMLKLLPSFCSAKYDILFLSSYMVLLPYYNADCIYIILHNLWIEIYHTDGSTEDKYCSDPSGNSFTALRHNSQCSPYLS